MLNNSLFLSAARQTWRINMENGEPKGKYLSTGSLSELTGGCFLTSELEVKMDYAIILRHPSNNLGVFPVTMDGWSTVAALKVLFPILLLWPMKSGMDVGDVAVKVELSHRCSATFSWCVTDGSLSCTSKHFQVQTEAVAFLWHIRNQ